jgi:hypothetical protein
MYGEKKNEYRVSVGRPERKIHLEDPGIYERKNIKLYHQEIWWV